MVVFEILEKVWATLNCVLVDMKIEFGIDSEGNHFIKEIQELSHGLMYTNCTLFIVKLYTYN